MLSHYRKRADECESRISDAKSDSVRENYRRLLYGWQQLIRDEEDRLTRIARSPARLLKQAGA